LFALAFLFGVYFFWHQATTIGPLFICSPSCS
jgi:hypothetical protein